ncbi:nucleotidyltransferase family protein [Anaerolineales bacterium HSG24]|nr:nucleotidyltransferase family protein [Anaerolineales bacterium HSG24]
MPEELKNKLQPKIPIPVYKIATLCQRYQVREMALFGSVLRDDFRPDSDVDILIEFVPDAYVTFIILGRIQQELSDLFERPVDLILRDGLKPTIRQDILSNSEVIYA